MIYTYRVYHESTLWSLTGLNYPWGGWKGIKMKYSKNRCINIKKNKYNLMSYSCIETVGSDKNIQQFVHKHFKTWTLKYGKGIYLKKIKPVSNFCAYTSQNNTNLVSKYFFQ